VTNSKDEFPTHEQIEQRAYEIYLERGGEDGQALEDWLIAEEELSKPQAAAVADFAPPKKRGAVAGQRGRS
jgi:Protein of unknown function (DUF2934)